MLDEFNFANGRLLAKELIKKQAGQVGMDALHNAINENAMLDEYQWSHVIHAMGRCVSADNISRPETVQIILIIATYVNSCG